MFYNASQKQEYIDFDNKNSDALRRYFQRIAHKENEYRKDIVDMDREELTDTLVSLNIRREASRGHLLSLMRGYIKWARLYRKTENNNVIESITAESIGSLETIRHQMLKSPEQLKEMLLKVSESGKSGGIRSNLVATSKEKYGDNYTNRFIRESLMLWLLYSGMDVKELQMLKKDNLDYEKNTVVTEAGKKYQIDDEIAKLWKHCADMQYIEKRNGKARIIGSMRREMVDEYSYCPLVKNDYLFRPIAGKGVANENLSIDAIGTQIFNFFRHNFPKLKMTASTIKNSGIFYRIYTLERKGEKITLEILAEHFDIKYDKESKRDLSLKIRRWKIDYEDWKTAFDYVN